MGGFAIGRGRAAAAAAAPAARGRGAGALLLRREGEVQEHAARAIMSLADCIEHQKQIPVAGAIPAVVQLLQGATPAVQDTAAGILGNLAIKNPANQAAIVAAGALPPLVNLLLKGSSPAKEQACFALWNRLPTPGQPAGDRAGCGDQAAGGAALQGLRRAAGGGGGRAHEPG
eukprot:jgi/Chrpa1/24422/Chrysochromulina_OHIO_Genome00026298-RA